MRSDYTTWQVHISDSSNAVWSGLDVTGLIITDTQRFIQTHVWYFLVISGFFIQKARSDLVKSVSQTVVFLDRPNDPGN